MIGIYFDVRGSFGNELGNIELDAVLEESHDWQAEVSMNPVEDGSPVADHVIEQPDKLRIRGFISENPIVVSNSIINSRNGGATKLAFDMMRDLIKSRNTVSVYTKYHVYTDMVITGLNIPRSSSTGEAIEFIAEFVHLRKVATQTVDVPSGISPKRDKKSTESIARKSEPMRDSGKRQLTEVKKPSSTLSRVFM